MGKSEKVHVGKSEKAHSYHVKEKRVGCMFLLRHHIGRLRTTVQQWSGKAAREMETVLLVPQSPCGTWRGPVCPGEHTCICC